MIACRNCSNYRPVYHPEYLCSIDRYDCKANPEIKKHPIDGIEKIYAHANKKNQNNNCPDFKEKNLLQQILSLLG